jgi:dienelactone hydrolase
MVKIGGITDAYLATPPADKEHKGAGVLYIADALGIWQNSQLLADRLAANGYVTLVPDLFNGDQLELNIDPVYPGNFDLLAWLEKGRDGAGPHTPSEVDPIIARAISYMKEDLGIRKIGSVGYCFGAKVRFIITHIRSVKHERRPLWPWIG